jgi:hypothetical protein
LRIVATNPKGFAEVIMAAVSEVNPGTVASAYVVRVVTTQIAGDAFLLYGEAVDLADGERVPNETTVKSVPAVGGVVDVSLGTGTLSRGELEAFLRDLEGGSARWNTAAFKTGRLVRREKTVVPVLHVPGDDGSTLHPDNRYTYILEELWDADEHTLGLVWETRRFREIGEAVAELVGVALHQVSERVGNFLVFDRLSPWRIDSQCDTRAPVRWVRAVADNVPPVYLRLHVRVLDGHETATEQVVDLPAQGVSVAGADYTQLSYSLFDSAGRLLARSAGTVIGEPVVSTGIAQPGVIVDSSGTSFNVEWSPWPGGSPSPGIRRDKPWISRSGRRLLRNLKQRERATNFMYGHNSAAAVTDRLRRILAEETSGFVYVWDPYLNTAAVLDVLQWIHPQVPCKILCGESSKPARLAALQSALSTFRALSPARPVECKHRVELRGASYLAHYHDRFLITKTAAWMLGSSLNSIGRAPGGIIRLFDPDPLRWMFEDEWIATLPTTVVETVL